MPLVVICGQPSSGKSTVARRLAQELQAAGVEALIVDEPSLHLKRDESYRGGCAQVQWQLWLWTLRRAHGTIKTGLVAHATSPALSFPTCAQSACPKPAFFMFAASADMPSEKNTRGHLRSEVERHLAR